MEKYEKFSNIAAGTQNLVVAIALVVGGIWSLYKFGMLEDVVSLNMRIEAEQIQGLSASHPTILVKVIATNNGTEPVQFDLSNKPLLIQRLSKLGLYGIVAEKSWHPLSTIAYPMNPTKPSDSLMEMVSGAADIPPKSTAIIKFIQEVDSPGFYFVAFGAPLNSHQISKIQFSNQNIKPAAKRLHGKALNPTWDAETYVSIVNPKTLAARKKSKASRNQKAI